MLQVPRRSPKLVARPGYALRCARLATTAAIAQPRRSRALKAPLETGLVQLMSPVASRAHLETSAMEPVLTARLDRAALVTTAPLMFLLARLRRASSSARKPTSALRSQPSQGCVHVVPTRTASGAANARTVHRGTCVGQGQARRTLRFVRSGITAPVQHRCPCCAQPARILMHGGWQTHRSAWTASVARIAGRAGYTASVMPALSATLAQTPHGRRVIHHSRALLNQTPVPRSRVRRGTTATLALPCQPPAQPSTIERSSVPSPPVTAVFAPVARRARRPARSSLRYAHRGTTATIQLQLAALSQPG